MYRQLLALLHQRKVRRATPCDRDRCAGLRPGTVHYHWGHGQRHTSMIPVTGPNSFSDGRPFVRV